MWSSGKYPCLRTSALSVLTSGRRNLPEREERALGRIGSGPRQSRLTAPANSGAMCEVKTKPYRRLSSPFAPCPTPISFKRDRIWTIIALHSSTPLRCEKSFPLKISLLKMKQPTDLPATVDYICKCTKLSRVVDLHIKEHKAGSFSFGCNYSTMPARIEASNFKRNHRTVRPIKYASYVRRGSGYKQATTSGVCSGQKQSLPC
jgi:hypothetical protein